VTAVLRIADRGVCQPDEEEIVVTDLDVLSGG